MQTISRYHSIHGFSKLFSINKIGVLNLIEIFFQNTFIIYARMHIPQDELTERDSHRKVQVSGHILHYVL